MIKFIFYTLFAYLLIKLFRVFLDPLFNSTVKQPNPRSNSNAHTPKKEKEEVLGEYIEYEEIKS